MNQETTIMISNLLYTIEEALQHMKYQIRCIDFESSQILFHDIFIGILSVSNALNLSLIDSISDLDFNKTEKDLRTALIAMTECYAIQDYYSVEWQLDEITRLFVVWSSKIDNELLKTSKICS